MQLTTETKGKTERGVGYIRQNFWVRVQVDVSAKRLLLPGLNLRAREWADTVANQRVHGTHGEVVYKRYLEEEPLLGKLEGRPGFDTSYHWLRRVGRDGRLSYRGKLYQVALRHALSDVEVAENLAREVTIRSKNGQLVRYEVVDPGKVASRQVVQPAERVEALGQGERHHQWEQRQEPGRGVGRLRLVSWEEPLVETRNLRVYEEVASGTHPG